MVHLVNPERVLPQPLGPKSIKTRRSRFHSQRVSNRMVTLIVLEMFTDSAIQSSGQPCSALNSDERTLN